MSDPTPKPTPTSPAKDFEKNGFVGWLTLPTREAAPAPEEPAPAPAPEEPAPAPAPEEPAPAPAPAPAEPAPLSIEDAAGTSRDYPFNKFRDWETYTDALGEAMSTEFAGETYPKYVSNDDDLLIVKRFIKNGLDPETALEDILDIAFTHGSRYCREYENTIISIVHYLHKVKKAPLCASTFLSRNADNDVEEDIASTVGTRAAILDTFRPKISDRTIANLRNTYENPPDAISDVGENEIYEIDDEYADAEFEYALIEESSYLTELVTAKPAAPAKEP
jgi:hypothetical protein